MTLNAIPRREAPPNELVREYAPSDPHTERLKVRLKALAGECVEIPCVVGGEEVRTGQVHECRAPHDHEQVLCRWHAATPDVVERAIQRSQEAWREWSEAPHAVRAAIFLKAADLLAGSWRDTLNASTMLGQSKTCFQAEIDAACELIDFWRFNVHFALNEIYPSQPFSAPGVWNSVEYRPLEGFVYAVTPFNFTAIAANLPTAPALLGNTIVWKPSPKAALAAEIVMQLLEAAGLPRGVINLVQGDAAKICALPPPLSLPTKST